MEQHSRLQGGTSDLSATQTPLPSPQEAQQKAGRPLLDKAPPHLPQQKYTDFCTAISKGSYLRKNKIRLLILLYCEAKSAA